MNNKTYTELYTIVFKTTHEILTPDSFKKYWENYGSNQLSGWRPPKKIYYTLGQARRGFSFVPDQLKEKLAIAKFVKSEIVEDGAELKKDQDERKLNRELKENKLREERRQEQLLKDLEETKNKLKRLESKVK